MGEELARPDVNIFVSEESLYNPAGAMLQSCVASLLVDFLIRRSVLADAERGSSLAI
jgi:hypothetical protein